MGATTWSCGPRTDATAWDIDGARVTSGGVVLDTSGIAIATAYAQFDPDVTSNGADYFVVWADHRGENNHDIYGARVSAREWCRTPAARDLHRRRCSSSRPR